MIEGTFIENPIGMREVLYSPIGPVGTYIVHLGRLTQDGAKAMVGVKTGNLREAIRVKFGIEEFGPAVDVGADNTDPRTEEAYAYYHHEGHPAIDGPLMVFTVDGETVFTHHVSAVPPNPFLRVPMERAVEGGTALGAASTIFADLIFRHGPPSL